MQETSWLGTVTYSLHILATLLPSHCTWARPFHRFTLTPTVRFDSVPYRLSLYATLAMLYCALFFLSDVPRTAKDVLGVVLLVFNIGVVAFFGWQVREAADVSSRSSAIPSLQMQKLHAA